MIRRKRATIKDVAHRAKVSTATVSFVLNDNPNEKISSVVRKRVLDAARQLNYHASAAAASLARKRIPNIGLVFYEHDDTVPNLFYSWVVQGAIKEAIERDYNLLFSYVRSSYRSYADLPKIVREKNAEGVLLMRRVHPRMVADIVELGIPIVAVDVSFRVEGINAVLIDDVRGGRIAARHLLGLGHRHLAMLLPRKPAPSVLQRLSGFRRAVVEGGAPFTQKNVISAAALTFEAGYDAVRRALSKPHDFTALFAGNDEMAAGALRAAREVGYRVPSDLSVIGFDDITMSNYTDPPLTTVGVVKEHMGRRAMARLIELVDGVANGVRIELAPVQLVQRASTSKPGLRAAAPLPKAPRARRPSAIASKR